jgi:succinate dehydrogenase / fumarate reductase membrane anchor subunit
MRNAGGARRGLNLWLWQRASALLMAILLPVFLVVVLGSGPHDYATWRELFTPAGARIAVFLFMAALLVHAWIGMREVFIDYVHPMFLRLPLYFLFACAYLAALAWTADILWSL